MKTTPWAKCSDKDLDWTVDKVPLFMSIQNVPKQLETHFALTRSDTGEVFGVCGKEYIPFQNNEFSDFIIRIVSHGLQYNIKEFGSVRNGLWVWALISIDGLSHKNIKPYILVANPHIWGKAPVIKFLLINELRNNTFTMSLGKKFDSYRLSHKKTPTEKEINQLVNLLQENILHQFNDFIRIYDMLNSKLCTEADVIRFAMEFFKSPAKLNPVAYEFIQQAMHHPQSGNWWSVFDTITYMVDYVLGNDRKLRLWYSWFDKKEIIKKRGLQLVAKYASQKNKGEKND